MIIPVVIVSVSGTSSDVGRDLGMANIIFNQYCGIWFEVVAQITVDRPELLVLSQEDCSLVGHVVSEEEDELYSLGRQFGADLVAYYIQGSTFGAGVLGCAAHPPDRRGFWLVDSPYDFVWAHEAGHVVGNNPHIRDSDNLMYPYANRITNLPADLNKEQGTRIINDPALLYIESIVLNL